MSEWAVLLECRYTDPGNPQAIALGPIGADAVALVVG